MIGKTVSHYKILQKLGEGGMGVVYKGEDINLKRPVALKFISPELTRDKLSNDQFIYEAQTASSLDHQNISTIYEIDKSNDGSIFISMAFYNGETLQAKISKGQIPIQETIRIAIQIADGLSRAHQKGIIHKDIKPANIIIDENSTIKIIDFGISELINQKNIVQPGDAIGTISYMSPEQFKGNGIDQRTDIWSLGVIIYEMLTGVRPFEGEYDQAIIYSIFNEDPGPMKVYTNNLPNKLERIVKKTLTKNVDNRYEKMEDLLIDLRRFSARFSMNVFNISGSEEEIYQPIKSIAVLPLVNLSQGSEYEYFADGMTDALITALAKIRILKVISRTSIMRYKATNKSLLEIAEELNVDTILEGSVLREDNKIKITAQLVHAITDTHIWAETYERDLHDVLILQSELVQAITKEIKISLTKKEEKRFIKTRPVNPEPYDNYLRGCFHLYKILPADYDKAIEYFNMALSKDPSFALAYTGIAKVWLVRNYWSIASAKESISNAKRAVLTALKLDKTLEEAHDVMARIKYFYDWDWEGAEKEFKQAIDLNPNYVESRLFYSAFLRTMNRNEEALIQVQKGLELDPINAFSQGFLVAHMLHLEQYDDAIRKLREIQKTERNSPFVHRYLWIAYHQKRNYDKALSEAKNYFSSVGKIEISDLFALRYSEVGYHGVMELVANKLKEFSSKTYVQPIWIARLFAYANKYDLAVKWLRIAYKERDPLIVNLGVSKDWDNLKDDSRYINLLHKLNLSSITK